MTIPGFVLHGPPRTKKTSNRIVQIRGKNGGRGFTKILPSEAHEAWHRAAMQEALLVKAVIRRAGVVLPLVGSVNVRAMFYRERLSGDAVGYYQALADLLEDAGIVANDSQVESWDGSRLLKDAGNPRVEVLLEVTRERAVGQDLFAALGDGK